MFLISQKNDTICSSATGVFACKITLINDQNIFYDQEFVSLDKVLWYSRSGVRTFLKNEKKVDYVDIGAEINYMRMCLRKNHNEWKAGTLCQVFGTFIAASGVFLIQTAEVKSTSDQGTQFTIVGGLLALVGQIIVLDSHKWINRAGAGVSLNENGIGVLYRFKN
jgi:hypothetical protein